METEQSVPELIPRGVGGLGLRVYPAFPHVAISHYSVGFRKGPKDKLFGWEFVIVPKAFQIK